MSLRRRLERLEQTAGTEVCERCGRALHGPVQFVLEEEAPTPEDLIPCAGCRRAPVFVLEMGSALDDAP